MTTGQLIVLDHAVALLMTAAWLAAGAVAVSRRLGPGAVRLLAGAAALVTVGRAASAAVLAERGWWFVQEKALLGPPLLVVVGLVALAGAGPGVTLLAAGYAATALFAVTIVAGYPLTWSAGLLAVAVVLVATLVTVRATTAPGGGVPSPGHVLPRRRFLALTGGAVAAGVAGTGLAFRSAPGTVTGGGAAAEHQAGDGVPVTTLRGPAQPAPGGVVRQLTLTARTATVVLASGQEVDAWTYGGDLPGPPITAVHGDLIEVTLRNDDLDDGVTLHWHGYDVPCGEDGAPGATQEPVPPGGTFTYRFLAEQVGTYWYHTHQVSHPAVRRGLFGTLVVTPRDEVPADLDLTLPVHTYDEVLAIGADDGVASHAAEPGAVVRLRLLNTDSEPHRFALTGTAFRLAAVDGRDLNGPGEVERRALRLPAGGRYDLTFPMPDGPVALLVDDSVRLRLGARVDGDGDDAAGTGDWPELDPLAYGEPAAAPFDLDTVYDRHFTMVLDRGVAMVEGRPTYAHTVDGRGHPSIPEQLVAEGDLVRLSVVNRSLETHPWHLHGHAVLVLARDGEPATGSPLWVDTFDVQPGEVWDVAFEATNPGVWMNHCHNLPHAEEGMMLQLRYDGVFADVAGGHGSSGSGHGAGHH
ncbi:multicopper oxidase family protein [Jiangella asiatica]|uniref:Multicopper oxidase family protein n=1 Tax=Jiangella asiatica TaxID=2530372 RepID=A0A4R5CN57_9ACTN|nr:multicopper oxidase family protein [Jiangella asiatica]TDD98982.1 multicopper oxidase family protein [Jiangella asiatica]